MSDEQERDEIDGTWEEVGQEEPGAEEGGEEKQQAAPASGSKRDTWLMSIVALAVYLVICWMFAGEMSH